MALIKLQFRPGINRETTAYANEGGWYDCNLIRFRYGKPESMAGWSPFSSTAFLGTTRSIMPWTALDGTAYIGMGTNLKYYAVKGNTFYDITPLRLPNATLTNPFTTQAAGSGIVTVTDVAHGCYPNDFVTFSGATAVSGITPAQLNKEQQVLTTPTADTYTINTGGSASAGGVTGGGTVTAVYQINTGLDTSVYGTGWGAGGWGVSGWGVASTSTAAASQLRIWSQDNYGEDLLMAVHDGGLYYWDTSVGVSSPAVTLASLPGANLTPTIVKQVIVSERDRHTIVFGCDPETNPGIQDPLVIRFSSQESLTDWETRADNTAGELRIGSGSEIIGAVQTKQQIVVFTDVSIHAMQYIGPPYTFGIQEISSGVSIMGPNAMVAIGDVVFWMGKGEFYVYSGSVAQIPCDVKEYVFNRLNTQQTLKINAGHSSSFSEVWWFYPSNTSTNGVVNTENDSYVIYNYDQKVWYYGEMPRTAWTDSGVLGYPLAASPDNHLYYQEYGLNDGSNNPPTALNPYIESSVVDLGEGDQFMFASRVIPDVTFRNSTSESSTVALTIKARNFPGDPFTSEDSNPVVKTANVDVDYYTDQVFIRLRGRSMSIRVESNQTNTSWRLGDPRLDVRPDGRR
jgi:hypothetical protein